jgi:hypothetical protein
LILDPCKIEFKVQNEFNKDEDIGCKQVLFIKLKEKNIEFRFFVILFSKSIKQNDKQHVNT